MRLALDLNLPADGRHLASTRKMLAACMLEFGAPTFVVDDVILAMDEACANVLKHAYPDDGGGHYRVRANLEQEQVLIEVVDEGIGFDVMAKPPPARDVHPSLTDSGRGLALMRRLMTTVEVESPTPAGGTRLRLTRVLPFVRD